MSLQPSLRKRDLLNLIHSELKDDPMAWWDGDTVEQIVMEYVSKWEIDLVSPAPFLPPPIVLLTPCISDYNV